MYTNTMPCSLRPMLTWWIFKSYVYVTKRQVKQQHFIHFKHTSEHDDMSGCRFLSLWYIEILLISFHLAVNQRIFGILPPRFLLVLHLAYAFTQVMGRRAPIQYEANAGEQGSHPACAYVYSSFIIIIFRQYLINAWHRSSQWNSIKLSFQCHTKVTSLIKDNNNNHTK